MKNKKTGDISAKLGKLAKEFDAHFLEIGRGLVVVQDTDPDSLHHVAEKAGIQRRKAYYLIQVVRAFEGLKIPDRDLMEVGWTKLMHLSKVVTKKNVKELVAIAKTSTVKQLEQRLRGEAVQDDTHCVLMYFTAEQYAQLTAALEQNGAQRSGRGLLNKEAALIKLIAENSKT